MAKLVLPPNDAGPLKAVFRSKMRTPTQRAQTALELLRLAEMQAQGNRDRKAYVDAIRESRLEVQRQMAGHKTWDPVDITENFLAIADTLSDALPAAGVVSGNPEGFCFGKLADMAIESVVQVGKDILSIPLVQDQIAGYRARNGGDAVHELTEAFEPMFDTGVDIVAQAILADAGGPLSQAVAELYEEVAADVNTPLDPSAGAVAAEHPEIFLGCPFTVQNDNSVVLEDIDALRTAVSDSMLGLEQQLQTGFEDVGEELKSIKEQQTQLAQGQAGILTFLKEQAAGTAQLAEIERAREQAAATMRAVWAGAEGTVAGAVGIASLLGDRQLANEISRYGTATIQVTQGIVQVADAMVALSKGFTAIAGLGAAAATGNLIGAVAALIGLFAPEAPDPSKQILDEIGVLEQGLGRLQEQIAEGFDRIDARLNVMYRDIMGALDTLATTVNVTYEQVVAIRELVVDVQAALDNLSVGTAAYFRAGARLDLSLDIDAALGYAQRNRSDLDEAAFDNFASHFYTWATTAVFDAINQPLQGRPVDAEHIAAELLNGSLPDNVSYLNRVLHARGFPALVPDVAPGSDQAPLPNPRLWALSAHAYAQIQAEWPRYAELLDPRRSEIADVALALRTAIQGLAVNPELFPSLIEEYCEAVRNYGAALDDARGAFERQELPTVLGFPTWQDSRLGGQCDIFYGGTEQEIDFRPSLTFMRNADGLPDLPAPTGLYCFVAPIYRLAEFFSLSQPRLTTTYRVKSNQWVTRRVVNPGNHPTVVETPHCLVTVSIRLQYEGRNISPDIAYERHYVGPDVAALGDPVQSVVANWQDYKKQFQTLYTEQYVQNGVYPPGYELHDDIALEAATRVADEGLRRARIAFFRYLIFDAERGVTARAAANLDGARALLEHLVNLLLPTPRTMDDLLLAIFEGESYSRGGVLLPNRLAYQTALARLEPIELPGSDPAAPMASWAWDEAEFSSTLLQGRLAGWQEAVRSNDFSNPVPGLDENIRRLTSVPSFLNLISIAEGLRGVREQYELYVVQAGDTLSSIADKYGLPNWDELYRINRAAVGPNPDYVDVGLELVIPT